MATLLYLVHRLPYPPNKGDKVRSYHLLRHLAARHRVLLGTFVDDPADAAHVDTLRQWCDEVHALPLPPLRMRLRGLAALAVGGPMTLHCYRRAALSRWVEQVAQRHRVDAAVVFSSAMAPYAQAAGLPTLLDFVDLDSAKWTDYAPRHPWPLSWLYAREGRTLLAYERRAAQQARHAFFVSEKEAALFLQRAPEAAGRVSALSNGVDAGYFRPDPARASPFDAGEVPLVFTGAMDYWPNVDAVTWFAREMLPALRRTRPRLRLHIVGRQPTAAVRALAADPAGGVVVTGTVPDVRPWLQHAAAVVAPLRLARGIQNKVLEAMAMGRPVVAARACGEAIAAGPADGLHLADASAHWVAQIDALLADPAAAEAAGAAARRCVLARYAWDACLRDLDDHLAAALGAHPDDAPSGPPGRPALPALTAGAPRTEDAGAAA